MTCKPAWRGFAATRWPRPETCLEPRREAMQLSQGSSSRRLCGSPHARRATMKSGDRDLKRATRACGFGLERLPWPGDGLFASACFDCYLARSARDSRAAAQIKLSLSRSHYQRAAGAEKL